MLNSNAVELENISFSYNNKAVFSELNLSVPEGSICTILGPNGTGKTTLLHLILGWLKPDNGSIRINGRNLDTLGPRDRGKTLSILPQKENLSFEYTVMEYILLGRAPYLKPLQRPGNEDRQTAAAALEKVNGGHLKEQKIPLLSGGETQTTLMARSLTQEPEILLLDEPANHLDPARRRQMIEIIRDFRKQKKTVIFTTHDPETAASTADHLVLINKNKTVYSGDFDSLFTEDRLSELYGIPVRITRLNDGTVTVTY